MRRLRAHPIIGARDYYHSYVIYMEELKLARGAGYFARLYVNYGVSTVMLVQQLCGISSKLPLVLRQVVPANGLRGLELLRAAVALILYDDRYHRCHIRRRM